MVNVSVNFQELLGMEQAGCTPTDFDEEPCQYQVMQAAMHTVFPVPFDDLMIWKQPGPESL